MLTCTQLWAVWKSGDDYQYGQPIAVCASEEAAWAVFNLLNPKKDARGNSCGPYPVKDVFYVHGTRPDLAEDAPPVPSTRYLDLTEAGREAQERSRDDEAHRQRKMGYYA